MFADREKGKVTVYVTTLGIVRETYERCLRMRKILWTLLVKFEERDVFMSRDNQIELLDRLRATSVSVPHIFLEGQYLGVGGNFHAANVMQRSHGIKIEFRKFQCF